MDTSVWSHFNLWYRLPSEKATHDVTPEIEVAEDEDVNLGNLTLGRFGKNDGSSCPDLYEIHHGRGRTTNLLGKTKRN